MYLKCFFALNGHLTVRTVLSPVSQTNVTAGGHGKGIGGLFSDMNARYEQALRHMWGALDIGFVLRKVVELWRNRKQATRTFRPLHKARNQLSAPNSNMDAKSSADKWGNSDVTQEAIKSPNYRRLIVLSHRMFEAHFLPVQMTVLVIASTLFMRATEGAADIHGVKWMFETCKYLRTMGVFQIAFYLFMYESFHGLAVAMRQREMTDAGLAEGMHFSHRSLRKNFLDYIMVPLVAPIYGALPSIRAQTCHLWTTDLVYIVSKKATRQRTKSTTAEEMA